MSIRLFPSKPPRTRAAAPLLCLVLGLLGGCQGSETVLVVTVSNVPAQTALLRVGLDFFAGDMETSLVAPGNILLGDGGTALMRDIARFGLQVPAGYSGTGVLQVDAVRKDGCDVAELVKHDVAVSAGDVIDVDVPLEALTPPVC